MNKLIDPYDLSELSLNDGNYLSKNGNRYKIENDIPILLNDNYLSGDNKKYQKMYDWMSFGYDIAEKIIGRIVYGSSAVNFRKALMEIVGVKNGDKILYVSIGTGLDLFYLPNSVDRNLIELTGADISLKMLEKCKKNFSKLKLKADLVCCCAEALPFENEIFDVVFHVGGINFFSDKQKAIDEMIRTAKNGAKIVICDETEKLASERYDKSVFTKKYYSDREYPISAPIELIPSEMEEISLQSLWNDRMYCISFRKPKA